MTIDDLFEMWQADGDIVPTNLTEEGRKTASLHNKYFRLLSIYSMKGIKLKSDLKVLVKAKREWYAGTLEESEMKARGWKPNRRKVIQSELSTYVDADPEIIELTLKIGINETIVRYLDSIVRQINNRGYQIRDMIEFEKFKNGMG